MNFDQNIINGIKQTIAQRDIEEATLAKKESEFDMLEMNLRKWKIYRVACQIRFAYFSFLIMLTILLFSFTVLMEIFFAVFLPSARLDPHFYTRSIAFLCILPFAIISLSWIFEESCRFFIDCLSHTSGGLFQLRISFITVIHYYRHLRNLSNITISPKDPYFCQEEDIKRLELVEFPSVDYTTFVLVDCFIPFLFEILTLGAFLFEAITKFSISKGFSNFITTGFYVTFSYFFLWIILHIWSNSNSKMRAFIALYILKRRLMKEQLNKVSKQHALEERTLEILGFRLVRSLFYWFSRLFHICKKKEKCNLPKALSIQETEENQSKEETLKEQKKKKKLIWNRLKFIYQVFILFPLLACSALLSIYSFYIGWLSMGILLIITANLMRSQYPRIFGFTFRLFITTFVILSFLFFSSTWLIGTFVHGGDFKVYPPSININISKAQPNLHWSNLPTYPICDFTYYSLDILDLVLIADAVYGSTTNIQKLSLNERFNGTQLQHYQYITRNDIQKDPVTWMELYFPSINVTVIAVRGTASATDALEDMHFWFGIGLFQFIPFLNQLPQDFVVNMLKVLSLDLIMPEQIYSKLEEHSRKVMKRVGSDNLILVGHSLGGAMAGIIGAKLSVPAVSFSGPGLMYTRGRFHLDEAKIRHFVITIKPMKDLVPTIDLLGGLVQQIDCQKTNPLTCHSTTTHACELYYSCGDKRKRDWSQAEPCKDFIQTKVLKINPEFMI